MPQFEPLEVLSYGQALYKSDPDEFLSLYGYILGKRVGLSENPIAIIERDDDLAASVRFAAYLPDEKKIFFTRDFVNRHSAEEVVAILGHETYHKLRSEVLKNAVIFSKQYSDLEKTESIQASHWYGRVNKIAPYGTAVWAAILANNIMRAVFNPQSVNKFLRFPVARLLTSWPALAVCGAVIGAKHIFDYLYQSQRQALYKKKQAEEYACDRFSGIITGHPEWMISALSRMSTYRGTEDSLHFQKFEEVQNHPTEQHRIDRLQLLQDSLANNIPVVF